MANTSSLNRLFKESGMTKNEFLGKVKEAMAKSLGAIEVSVCDNPSDFFNGRVIAQYVTEEDITREFIKRCTNGNVFEKLMEGYNVCEIQSDGLGLGMVHVTSYLRAAYPSKLALVIGNEVIETPIEC